MRELSFNIKDSKEFLKKLIEDYYEFKQDHLSSRLAINCAMTAWHLIDWIFHEYYSSSTSLSNLQSQLKAKCPSLQIMHDIPNGSKHYRLTKHKPEIKKTDLHQGGFSSGFGFGFNVSALFIEKEDVTTLYFEEEIEKVISFWQAYFRSELDLTI